MSAVVALLSIGLAACASTAETPVLTPAASPASTPRPIVITDPQVGSSSAFLLSARPGFPPEIIDVTVISKYFAEPGYFADSLDRQIFASLKILLDGSVVPSQNLDIFSSLKIGGGLYDANGKLVGGYSGSVEAYILTDELKRGTHTVFVSASKPSGEILSASWQFIIGP